MTQLLLPVWLVLLAIPDSIAQNTTTKYRLSPSTSTLHWAADYVIGKGHEGTIRISSGNLRVLNGEITTGDFEMDMNSIRSTDINDERSRQDLEEHLRSDDFFSAARFPVSTLSIVSVKEKAPGNYVVNGYLTVAGVTHTLSFPAAIEIGSTIKVKATFSFDRTKWGIVYQSKSIFDTIKDSAISDFIEIAMELEFVIEN